MLFYNCSVFIYSTVAGHRCEINLITNTTSGATALLSVVKRCSKSSLTVTKATDGFHWLPISRRKTQTNNQP